MVNIRKEKQVDNKEKGLYIYHAKHKVLEKLNMSGNIYGGN